MMMESTDGAAPTRAGHSVFQSSHSERPAPLFPAVALRRYRQADRSEASDEMFRLEKQREYALKIGAAEQMKFNLDDSAYIATTEEAAAESSSAAAVRMNESESDRAKRRQMITNKRFFEHIDDIMRTNLYTLELVEPPNAGSKRARRGGGAAAGAGAGAGGGGKKQRIVRERQASIGQEIEALEAREREGEGLEEGEGREEGADGAPPRRAFGELCFIQDARSHMFGTTVFAFLSAGAMLTHMLLLSTCLAGADEEGDGEGVEEYEEDDDEGDYGEDYFDNGEDGDDDGDDDDGGREAEY